VQDSGADAHGECVLQVLGDGAGTVNTLAFIASVIGSLAWPVTLFLVLFLLLRNGVSLARFVKSIRFKDFELTLRNDLEKARDIAESIQIRFISPITSEDRQDSENKVLLLAQIDPGVAILKSWQKLDLALTKLIQHNGLIRYTNKSAFVRRLLELDKITESDLALFDRLRSIRNAVVHARSNKGSISVAEVVEYDQLVDTLIRRLEQIRAEPGYIDVK
jgi:hypothetical protein